MPSSVGHILAGLAVSRLSGGTLRNDWPYVLLATAPDLDVVVAVVRKKPVDYRNRRSHSAGAVLAAAAAAGLAARLVGEPFLSAASKGGACYASHLILDYFGKEAADGLPLLWPFSHRRLSARRPVFRTIYSYRGNFFAGLLNRRNMKKVFRETVIVTPFLIAADVAGRRLAP